MRIRYLTTEPLADEVVDALKRTGAHLSTAERLDDPRVADEPFETVLYDAATLESNEGTVVRRLRTERPELPVLGVVDALDSVASVPTSLDPLVDGWIEKAVLRTAPGHVVSLLDRAVEYRSEASAHETAPCTTSPSDPDRDAGERLRTKNRCLESVRATLSHDLRNPLMVAREYAILGRETGNDEHLDRVDSAIGRASTLVDELVAVARAGRGLRSLVEVSIRDATTDAWEAVGSEPASLTVEADRHVRADPSLLALFFEVLFEHTITHLGAESSIRVDANESGVLITVDGPDVAADEYRTLRRAFVDPDNDDSAATVLSAIADAHGWELSIAEPDDGDGFRLHIAT
ncbi:sensor histidine kinase [Halalkalicoccus subterraneus]|uniref:sensor histidine kinase n=1 Tax=Halalkalicoccus subterraneus TaxID=2675002 RepID=UPI000EFA5827|nr:histidine kinase dimerization/phospho-acceptor domain-containing protein [Halalkalicoccus subterraneus]